MIKFNKNESAIILHLKHWSKWETREGLEILYKHIYQYDRVELQSIFEMVFNIFVKLWKAQDCNPYSLQQIFSLSLPSENWKVSGGHKFENNLWYNSEEHKFNNEQLLWANITAMGSYIRLTDAKYMELEEINFDTFKKYSPFENS